MKKHLILLLKTLFNNNACVEAARTREKKYNIIPVVFAVVALFLSALPVTVTGFQQQGQNWVSATNNVDDGLYNFGKAVKNIDIALPIEEVGTNKKHAVNIDLDALKSKNVITEAKDYPITDKAHTLTKLNRYTYIDKPSPEQEATFILEIYFFDDKVTDAAKNNIKVSFTEYCSYIANNKNPYNTNENLKVQRVDGKDDVVQLRNNSFIVFAPQQFFCANFNLKASGQTKATLFGDYDNTKPGTDILHAYYDEAGYQTGTLAKWKVFFNEGYINYRWAKTWQSTGLVLGINGGVLLFMGFMVWILTRGKNNPFRIYTIWDGQKIAYYACLTPGLLSLFGFLSSSLSMMLFVLMCGVRVMWLSMRTLRYNAPAK